MSERHTYGTLLSVGERCLDTIHGEFTAHVFENLVDCRPVIAVVHGDLSEPGPLLARVHSSCVTSEAYGGRDCDCAEQLSQSLAAIAGAGRGALFYLMQEGRGAGFAAKARDRMLVQASDHRLTTFEAYEQMGLARDLRRYDEVGFACRLLGVRGALRLLTNNPGKVEALAAAGVEVDGTLPLAGGASPWNLHYVDAKRRSGHALDEERSGVEVASLPEPVEAFEPYALDDDPSLVRMASYLLPVAWSRSEEIAWFRVHVWFDATAGTERVLLTHGDLERRVPLVCMQEEDLFDRFPLRRPGPARRRWQTTVREIVTNGAGCALFVSAEGLSDPPGDGDVGVDAALIARHLPGRRARPMLDRRAGGNVFWDALLAQGLSLEPRVLLDEIR